MRNIRSYPGGVPLKIKYPEIPVYAFIDNCARKFPNRNAITYLGTRITYSKLWNESKKIAFSLRSFGLKKGERVALLLPNIPQFLISYFAILSAGGIVVPINPLLSRDEIKRELNLTESKIIIVLDLFLNKLDENIECKFIVTNATTYAPLHLRVLSRFRTRAQKYHKRVGQLNFIDLLGNYSLKELEKIDAKKDIAAILFTAGTTGQPKGVMLTHYNLVVNALQSYYWLRGWGYVSKPQVLGWPVVLCAVPFFHSYGMVVMNEAVQFGCTLVLVPKPTSEDMLKSIMDYKVTHFPTIPRFVKEILNHEKLEKYDLSSLSHCASGGSSISLEHIKAFESLSGARFYQGYGLTEAGPSTHATPVEGEPKHGSVGFAYPDTEVKIVDLKIGEVEIPEGRIGEIIVKGPQVMKGYWKDPEATKNVLRNGWLYTGDVGYLDSDGFLYVVGRKRDRILARGHAVYPNTVEEVIQSHPFVDTAIAVGVTDPLRCSTNVIGIVVLKKKASISEEALIKYCAETLEPYQVPSEIEFFEKLPMSPIGKVDRYLVEKMVTEKIVKYANGFKENSGS